MEQDYHIAVVVYAGLVMVETKCIEVDNKQATLLRTLVLSQSSTTSRGKP